MAQTPMTDGMPKRAAHMPEDYGQTFLQKCAGACFREGYAQASGGKSKISAHPLAAPEAPVTGLHDRWVVSLGVHSDAHQGADATQVHLQLVRAELFDGLGVAVTRQAAGG